MRYGVKLIENGISERWVLSFGKLFETSMLGEANKMRLRMLGIYEKINYVVCKIPENIK